MGTRKCTCTHHAARRLLGDAGGRLLPGRRSVRRNDEELPRSSVCEGRTMEPQCRPRSRGHDQPICQPGRAAAPTPGPPRAPTPPPTPPSAHTMESGRSRASGNGGEFPVCYNKMESSILVTEGIGHSWVYTQNTSLCTFVKK